MFTSNRINPIFKLVLKTVLVFLIVVIVIGVSWMSNALVRQMADREQEQLRTYAEIYKHYILSQDTEDALFFLDVITPTLYFPLIITDEKDEPVQDYISFTLNMDALNDISSIEKQRVYLLEQIQTMKEKYAPILITDEEGVLIAKFYYSHSPLLDMIWYFPLLSIIIVIMVVLMGYFAFNAARNNEQSRVWVGMARETAHQLGTPISSLLAWLELLLLNKEEPQLIESTVKEINNDIERLNTIATRFSKIGSNPEMKAINISQKIDEVLKYYEVRLPRAVGKITLQKDYEDDINVVANEMLISWVFENLIKNAVEAMEGKPGTITISVHIIGMRKVQCLVADTGKGMTTRMRYQIFEPGFTTKKRGWGIGLNLVKRIIEEYHKGKVYVKDSSIGKGTTFAIELPFTIGGKILNN